MADDKGEISLPLKGDEASRLGSPVSELRGLLGELKKAINLEAPYPDKGKRGAGIIARIVEERKGEIARLMKDGVSEWGAVTGVVMESVKKGGKEGENLWNQLVGFPVSFETLRFRVGDSQLASAAFDIFEAASLEGKMTDALMDVMREIVSDSTRVIRQMVEDLGEFEKGDRLGNALRVAELGQGFAEELSAAAVLLPLVYERRERGERGEVVYNVDPGYLTGQLVDNLVRILNPKSIKPEELFGGDELVS